jgi:hypothetical protein
MSTTRRIPSDAELKRLDREGVLDPGTGKHRKISRSGLAALYGVSPQRIRTILGPIKRRGRGFEITVRVDANTPDAVREKAAELGYVAINGSNAGQGSANELLAAAAEGEILLAGKRGPQPRYGGSGSMTIRLPVDAPGELRMLMSDLGWECGPSNGFIGDILDAIACGDLKIVPV